MNFNSSCLGGCTPPQIVTFSLAINDISTIKIYNDCDCLYDANELKYAYSLDFVCWSCYMSYRDVLTNTIELNQDFYVKIEVAGIIGKIEVDDNIFTDYSTEIKGCFTFASAEQSGTYNPYANMENAIALNQQLAESVSQLTGIPCYYIKLNPNQGSKDITFKEYALMNVDSIKQVKIIIVDNQMPSSKPEFSDWGLDWQTDWEVEVTKGSFATAFGNTAQPMEGDLVYIPMMKRMWIVNGAYEEKKDAFMWIATTFKLMLVKYQEKDSVDLGDAQSFVDSVVKNKYEDLFGEDTNATQASNEAALESPKYAYSTLYSVYESDAVRSHVTCDTVQIEGNNLYYQGTLISDNKYSFTNVSNMQSRIIYQNKYCGNEIVMSFIIHPFVDSYSGTVFQIGHVKLNIDQNDLTASLYFNIDKDYKIELETQHTYFIVIRWNKKMNLFDMNAYKYVYDENIPQYKLNKYHYWFDIDNIYSSYNGKYNEELTILEKTQIEVNSFFGWITNFKVFDLYMDNIADFLQMYPNNQHLIINDTARKFYDLPGVKFN